MYQKCYKTLIITPILGYCDANWVGCVVDWRSNKVLLLGLEAKYRSMALATCELVWIKHLLPKLKCCAVEQMKLYYDNQAALHIASNLVFHERTKHKSSQMSFCQGRSCCPILVLHF